MKPGTNIFSPVDVAPKLKDPVCLTQELLQEFFVLSGWRTPIIAWEISFVKYEVRERPYSEARIGKEIWTWPDYKGIISFSIRHRKQEGLVITSASNYRKPESRHQPEIYLGLFMWGFLGGTLTIAFTIGLTIYFSVGLLSSFWGSHQPEYWKPQG